MIGLMKSHLSYYKINVQTPSPNVKGIDINDIKCTNKHKKIIT